MLLSGRVDRSEAVGFVTTCGSGGIVYRRLTVLAGRSTSSMTTRGTKQQEKEAESSSQPQESEGMASTSKAMIELRLEQQKTQQEQQRMLMSLLEQQRDELTQHRKEMSELRARQEEKVTARLLKPALQKLGPDDDVEHFLATFERIARQQGWPEKVWVTQLVGLLTGKALAMYVGLNGESAASYAEVKKAIFHRYNVSEETHRRRFRTDRKSPKESFQNWGDHLRDHFDHWTKDQKMSLAEHLDQFLGGVPEDLRVWLTERKPESL